MAQIKKYNIGRTNSKVVKAKIAYKKKNSRGTTAKRKPLLDKQSSQALKKQMIGHLEDHIYKHDGQIPPWYQPLRLDENGDMYQIAKTTQREYMEHARNDFQG
ncbi:hypothetical protein N7488_011975 [Penicillium malachiteum]|nr:hypothetical protein N7488_011975 [Penicillium malachiteum]